MGRRRSKVKGENSELELTPMIDVVFQLLIFFIVTMKQPDVIGKLDVFRPAPDANAFPDQQPEFLRLTVLSGNRYMLNQIPMELPMIERNLKDAAERGTDQTVIIQCGVTSSHHSLVSLLDICTKVGLTELSVMTLPTGAKS